MRLHVNQKINTAEIHTAARNAGVTTELVEWHRSRSHVGAFEVRLSGGSSRRSQGSDYQAATWDEWGMFLAALYALDPTMVVGSGTYLSADHFTWATGGRFNPEHPQHVTPATQHRQHRWQPGGMAVTGSYHVQHCKGVECTAHARRVAHGHTWDEIASN